MTPISRAIQNIEGGQAALARRLAVSPQAVNQWVNGHRPVPPKHAIAIEAATGVTRHELRPDVFGAASAEGQGVADAA